MEKNSDKYQYEMIYLEITRRCNKKCAHCLRGDAQDVTITKEIVDKLFNSLDSCSNFYLTGGEPLLEPDILLYTIEKITEMLPTKTLSITTNGSILNKDVVVALERFCQAHKIRKQQNRYVRFEISEDQYHTAGECQAAYDFYKPLFDAANVRLGCADGKKQMILKRYSPISEHEVNGKKVIPRLIHSGRGVELYRKTDYEYKIGTNVNVPSCSEHRLKIMNDIVYCKIHMTANGDVVLAAENDSYETFDMSSSGNILEKSLDEIVNEHQENCLITCNETNIINSERTRAAAQKKEFRFDESITTQFLYEIDMIILGLRKAVKQLFPILPAQDIIIGLQMPKSDKEVYVYADTIYKNIPPKSMPKPSKQMMREYFIAKRKFTDIESQLLYYIMYDLLYIQENNAVEIIVNKLLKSKIWILEKQAASYQSGVFSPSNGWVFPCGSDEIFANHDTRDMRGVKREKEFNGLMAQLNKSIEESKAMRNGLRQTVKLL